MTAKRIASNQSSLFPQVEGTRWKTSGIFSDHFLRNRLSQSPFYPTDDQAKPPYDFVSDLWRKKWLGLAKRNEEVTRTEFLNEILKKMGFAFLPNIDLPESDRRQVPDYLLFADEQTKDRVFNESLKAPFASAIALMEAKKVNHPLDQISRKDTPGRFPHQQVQDYLRAASDGSGSPYFRWAILSNGNIWRLYCRDAHPSAYFEFHLAGPEDYFCTFEEFKVFLALFQPQVFVTQEGRCELDNVRDDAIVFQTSLEEDLRRRVYTVVADLANGFWSNQENGITEGELPTLYKSCLIFLYRLLFILYAESRGLLPVKLSGAGSNKQYRERFSLYRLIPKLKRPGEFQSDLLTGLYDELLKLFHLINGDKQSLSTECGVPRYNGGLFNPASFSELEKWRVGEKSLAKVLRDLIFSSGHTEATDQPEFELGPIDYADLEVRQLGDIYEGLLGGHLEVDGGKLVVRSEHGELQISGTFYTPDWVVKFLVERTLNPLIEEIEKSDPVVSAKKKKKTDNSFAVAVLHLNILDNAMGSGHFLVRATEWLADQIVYHQTTKYEVEKVPPGVSQEQAEISHWRRRVVEACIYGVDSNPLAVELTKLSLWLTCIAVEEPLNFLDHHLRVGNSLLDVHIHELSLLPDLREDVQMPFTFEKELTAAVGNAIHEIEAIEEQDSSEIDIVKKKEARWRDKVVAKLQPFKNVADLWIAAASGLKLNESEYFRLANGFVEPPKPRTKDAQQFNAVWDKYRDEHDRIVKMLVPFHWELEFPDVFFDEDGSRKDNPGFDAILGNPPYISTQTSSEFAYRNAVDRRFGFVDDLYVHFVFQGFSLLRIGGMFGYIVSDTFFTLATKLPMRELLQRNHLFYLAQCDPFSATVDAAIFIARKEDSLEPYEVSFIQARYDNDKSTPEKEFEKLAGKPFPLLTVGQVQVNVSGSDFSVLHGFQRCLRLHRGSVEIYRQALKKSFFEPREQTLELYNRFNDQLKGLVHKWWDKIDNSKKYDENRNDIAQYLRQLQPGNVTLVGLISDGGQGMRTANNGRFLGYLEGSDEAEQIIGRREELTEVWMDNKRVAARFRTLMQEHNDDFESVVETLKSEFNPSRDLSLKRGELYRVVPQDAIATASEFAKAYEIRKVELEELWRSSDDTSRAYAEFKNKFGDDFIGLFTTMVDYASRLRMALSKLGLHAGEYYSSDEDAPRIAAIYNGLPGNRSWVPFRKGDPEGNKWTDVEPLFIDWNSNNVRFLHNNSGRPEPNMPVVRNAHLYFTEGVTYTLLGNHVALKAKMQPKCVFDAGASRLTPVVPSISSYTFLAVLNSDLFSYVVRKFIKNTAAYEINDLRMAPFVMPNSDQASRLELLAQRAVEAKQLALRKQDPPADLVQFSRNLAQAQMRAPTYLRPRPQLLLLASAEDCLNAIELSVQWEVEKLYGVEGLGPFDEF